MNWVGGVNDVNAAGALLGQGGIPNVAVISGGKIRSFRLEQQVPFDAQALVDEIKTSATINETEGWVQNVPEAAIEQKLEKYQ
jgi:hypothetical protein